MTQKLMQIDKNNRVVQILVKRDGITVEEAIEQCRDCAEAMLDAIAIGDDPEEELQMSLGLEPDFVFDLIDLY